MKKFFVLMALLCMLSLPMLSSAQDTMPELFIAGSAVNSGSNGIIFDNDNNLVVASALSSIISIVDPESGDILETYDFSDGITNPDDVFVMDDGTILYTDILGGAVGMISPDGERSTLAQLPPGSNPITMTDNGRLFVSLCFLGDDVYEIDVETGEFTAIVEDLGGCGLNGMDIGPDGALYGPLWFGGAVARVDLDTFELNPVADSFTTPAALKFDNMGTLHVVDAFTQEVIQVDLETGELTVIASLDATPDNLAFDADNRLYVSSFSDGSVVEVLDDGSLRTVLAGGIMATGGLTVQGDTLYVADFLALKGYDLASGDQTYNVPDVIGFSPLGAVSTVASYGDNLLTTSWFTSAVNVWNPETNELVGNYTDFGVPLNAIEFDGDIIVADLISSSVIWADGDNPEDRMVLTDAMTVPAGLVGDGSDLYAGDWATGEIWQLIDDGEILDSPMLVVDGLVFPEGLALDGDELLIVETGVSWVSSYNLETGDISVVAEIPGGAVQGIGLPIQEGYPPTNVFTGLALDADGNLYVAGDIVSGIYRIAR